MANDILFPHRNACPQYSHPFFDILSTITDEESANYDEKMLSIMASAIFFAQSYSISYKNNIGLATLVEKIDKENVQPRIEALFNSEHGRHAYLGKKVLPIWQIITITSVVLLLVATTACIYLGIKVNNIK